jgi:hypothetical protein
VYYPLSYLPSLPATVIVLQYFRVVLILVPVSRLFSFITYNACSFLVSLRVLIPAIILIFILVLIFRREPHL